MFCFISQLRDFLYVFLGLTLFLPTISQARIGDWGDPLPVDSFPFIHSSSTTPRLNQIDRYDCASNLSEQGPEVVYRFQIPQAGRVSARVEGDNGVVDIDLQLMQNPRLSNGEITGCLDRNNRFIEADLQAGSYFLSVDTYESAQLAGAYTLYLNFSPQDGWSQRPIAQGVTLETRHYSSLFGGNQFGSVIRVDLDQPNVEIRPVSAVGCQTTSQIAQSAGAVAAVNGGYFGGGQCGSVSLLKINGRLESSNARSRSAFGLTQNQDPLMDWIPAGQDWPEAYQAIGGLSRLASGGQVDVEWERDQADYGFTYYRNPRTGVGFNNEGEVILATLDGRTSAGAGVSLFDFGQWFVWLGVDEALNLDGGGSTTLWVQSEGVVNYPSDNGIADHAGERGVANVLAVFAPPLNRDTLWFPSILPDTAYVDRPIQIELFGLDPDGLSLDLHPRTNGQGRLDFTERGDGSLLLTYQPLNRDPNPLVISVDSFVQTRTGSQENGTWVFSLPLEGTIQGTDGPDNESDGGFDGDLMGGSEMEEIADQGFSYPQEEDSNMNFVPVADMENSSPSNSSRSDLGMENEYIQMDQIVSSPNRPQSSDDQGMWYDVNMNPTQPPMDSNQDPNPEPSIPIYANPDHQGCSQNPRFSSSTQPSSFWLLILGFFILFKFILKFRFNVSRRI